MKNIGGYVSDLREYVAEDVCALYAKTKKANEDYVDAQDAKAMRADEGCEHEDGSGVSGGTPDTRNITAEDRPIDKNGKCCTSPRTHGCCNLDKPMTGFGGENVGQ